MSARESLRQRAAGITPFVVSEWFAAANLAFLAVDILLAHAENAFARRVEWTPIVFSVLAPLLLAPALVRPSLRETLRPVGLLVGVVSILTGLLGMYFHLESGFFANQTLHELVYTAPFVAPLSYVGLGLLLLLNRLEEPRSLAWAQWVLLLALGGCAGNLALSLLDHAQNGFFSLLEWVPVVTAAFGTSFLLVALVRPAPGFLRACFGVLLLQVAVGVLGFALHLRADLHRPGVRLEDRLIYGAPVFAPLLFADLAALAAIGLWALLRVPAAESAREARVGVRA